MAEVENPKQRVRVLRLAMVRLTLQLFPQPSLFRKSKNIIQWNRKQQREKGSTTAAIVHKTRSSPLLSRGLLTLDLVLRYTAGGRSGLLDLS